MNKVSKYEDMNDLDGTFEIMESGEVMDIADIRHAYDGQFLTLRKVN